MKKKSGYQVFLNINRVISNKNIILKNFSKILIRVWTLIDIKIVKNLIKNINKRIKIVISKEK